MFYDDTRQEEDEEVEGTPEKKEEEEKEEEKRFRDVKVVVVGDGGVGKTCLCNVFVKREFPDAYEPTVFENYSEKLQIFGQVGSAAVIDSIAVSRQRPEKHVLSVHSTYVYNFHISKAPMSTMS